MHQTSPNATHQESLNPYVYLDGIRVHAIAPFPEAPPYRYKFKVDYRIENAGAGPAIATIIDLTVNGMKDGSNLGQLQAGAFLTRP